jgi:4-amino-4-deoxy-L-arabinose transferase-like glycosyltransferase
VARPEADPADAVGDRGLAGLTASAPAEPSPVVKPRPDRLWLVFAIALAVRGTLFLLAVPDERRFFTLDAGGYIALARNLGAGYAQPDSDLFATGLMRTPGYPLFAAGVLSLFGTVVAVILAQVALSIATIALVCRLGPPLVGPAAAWVAAILLALDPVSAIYTNQLQPEALFTVLVVGGVLAWVRAVGDASMRNAALAGLLLGLAALTRPIGLYLPVVLLGWTFRGRRRVVLAAGLLGPFLLLTGAWVARNAAMTGVPMLSTIQGLNFLEYRAVGAMAWDLGIPVEEARRRLRGELARVVPTGANPAEMSRVQTRLAFQVMREHPGGVVRATVDGAVRMLAGNGLTALSRLCGDEDPENVGSTAKRFAAAGLGVLLAALYAGGAWGAVALVRDGRGHALALIAAVVAYFVLISAGPEANTRFRFPAMPFLCLLAGAGWARLIGKGVTSRAARP